MQIALQQNEIIDALKQYIGKQGINLSGKDVSIAFTAGRKGTGLSAEIFIEDGEAVTQVEEPKLVPKLTSVVSPAYTLEAKTPVNPPVMAEAQTATASPFAVEEDVQEVAEPEPAAAPVKTVSLFN